MKYVLMLLLTGFAYAKDADLTRAVNFHVDTVAGCSMGLSGDDGHVLIVRGGLNVPNFCQYHVFPAGSAVRGIYTRDGQFVWLYWENKKGKQNHELYKIEANSVH